MVQLSEDQVNEIWREYLQGKVENEELQGCMLDHLCCQVELMMDEGKAFDEAVSKAVQATCPGGADEIENELNLLISIKPNNKMKRVLYFSGFFAIFSLCLSIISGYLHFQEGRSFFMIFTFITLLVFVLPSLVTMAYRNRKLLTKYDWIRTMLGVISTSLIATGLIFKYLYFPMAQKLFLTGMILLTLLFLPMFFFHLYKRTYF